MKKIFFTLLTLFSSYSIVNAQIINTPTGNAVTETSYVNIVGTPYLNPDWVKGSATLENGQTFTDLDLKYDVVKGVLFFKSNDDKILGFVDPVKEFTLSPGNAKFANGFSGIKDFTAKSYFQVLNAGKVKILKKDIKNVVERREYNSASTTKTFVSNTSVFLLGPDGQALPLKKDKKFILTVLSDKAAPLEAYINDKKPNFKNEADIVALIDYYNTL